MNLKVKEATTYDPAATRKKLLDAAFLEMWRKGFRAASLDAILVEAGVTKGALYHHFKNKNGLGHAVIDEVVRVHMREQWVVPLANTTDPIGSILGILEKNKQGCSQADLECGCPLNNFAQEMSPICEGFRKRIESVFQEWRDAIAGALKRGQDAGGVRADLNVEYAAIFLVACIEGAVGETKNSQCGKVYEACVAGLSQYLASIREE